MVLAPGAGEQAIVADAVESARQGVEQEAAEELVSRERHDLLPSGAGLAVVLVPEGDALLIEAEEAAVRYRDPVGVARQIGEHGLRSEEHTSELQSLMRKSYAVFCLKKKKQNKEYTKRKRGEQGERRKWGETQIYERQT